MKVIRLMDIEGTERQVECPKGNFVSNRFLLESDGMGYSITKTIIPKGTKAVWHYTNHLESCYCIRGWGGVKRTDENSYHEIREDVLYVLDEHDEHEFFAMEETELLCVFNPPLKGREIHNKKGEYEV